MYRRKLHEDFCRMAIIEAALDALEGDEYADLRRDLLDATTTVKQRRMYDRDKAVLALLQTFEKPQKCGVLTDKLNEMRANDQYWNIQETAAALRRLVIRGLVIRNRVKGNPITVELPYPRWERVDADTMKLVKEVTIIPETSFYWVAG